MDCKHCDGTRKVHYSNLEIHTGYRGCHYTPKVLDELGNIWYYLRILAWQNEITFEDFIAYTQNELSIIETMYEWANIILQRYTEDETIEALQEIYEHLLLLLEKSGCTIDQLTELNYQKLNSEETNHGWREAK